MKTVFTLHYECVYLYFNANNLFTEALPSQGAVGEGWFIKAIDKFKAMSELELMQWLEYEKTFDSFIETAVNNSKGKYAKGFVKVTKAWLVETPAYTGSIPVPTDPRGEFIGTT